MAWYQKSMPALCEMATASRDVCSWFVRHTVSLNMYREPTGGRAVRNYNEKRFKMRQHWQKWLIFTQGIMQIWDFHGGKESTVQAARRDNPGDHIIEYRCQYYENQPREDGSASTSRNIVFFNTGLPQTIQISKIMHHLLSETVQDSTDLYWNLLSTYPPTDVSSKTK
jgi:hypothetical protein